MNTNAVTQLKFRKKITAVFADGSSKMNINVASAIALIANASPDLTLAVDQSEEATALLKDFVEQSGARAEKLPGQPGMFRLAMPKSNTEDVERIVARPAALGAGFGASSLGSTGPTEKSAQATADLSPKTAPASMITDPEALGKPTPQRNPGYIVLGPSAIYMDAHAALNDLLTGSDATATLSDHYHNKLTATFKAGSADGHLKSLFRDFRKFGLRIGPKLVEYRNFVLDTEWPADHLYARYAKQFLDGILPTDPAAFENNSVSSRYFKFWALLTAAVMKPGDVKRANR